MAARGRGLTAVETKSTALGHCHGQSVSANWMDSDNDNFQIDQPKFSMHTVHTYCPCASTNVEHICWGSQYGHTVATQGRYANDIAGVAVEYDGVAAVTC